MSNTYCTNCGNRGFDDHECPECGRPPKSLGISRMDEAQIKVLESKLKELDIPSNYIGVEWSAEVFWSLHPEYIDIKSRAKFPPLDRCIVRMKQAHDFFVNRTIPTRSFVVIMPPHMSKMVWAYSCMQYAFKAGYTVAPLLDTQEVSGFLGAGLRNPHYKLYNLMTLEEYIMSDVLFMTVTKTELRKSSYATIREVMDRRARRGKATFIISQYGIEEFSADEDTGYTLRWMNPNIKEENPHKVPLIVAFKDPNEEKTKGRYWHAKFNK